jgi:hypothetical protein
MRADRSPRARDTRHHLRPGITCDSIIVMVGRSGVLTPSISYQYTTINDVETSEGVRVVALTSSVQFDLGYTAMW